MLKHVPERRGVEGTGIQLHILYAARQELSSRAALFRLLDRPLRGVETTHFPSRLGSSSSKPACRTAEIEQSSWLRMLTRQHPVVGANGCKPGRKFIDIRGVHEPCIDPLQRLRRILRVGEEHCHSLGSGRSDRARHSDANRKRSRWQGSRMKDSRWIDHLGACRSANVAYATGGGSLSCCQQRRRAPKLPPYGPTRIAALIVRSSGSGAPRRSRRVLSRELCATAPDRRSPLYRSPGHRPHEKRDTRAPIPTSNSGFTGEEPPRIRRRARRRGEGTVLRSWADRMARREDYRLPKPHERGR